MEENLIVLPVTGAQTGEKESFATNKIKLSENGYCSTDHLTIFSQLIGPNHTSTATETYGNFKTTTASITIKIFFKNKTIR